MLARSKNFVSVGSPTAAVAATTAVTAFEDEFCAPSPVVWVLEAVLEMIVPAGVGAAYEGMAAQTVTSINKLRMSFAPHALGAVGIAKKWMGKLVFNIKLF